MSVLVDLYSVLARNPFCAELLPERFLLCEVRPRSNCCTVVNIIREDCLEGVNVSIS
jgi:hypothetical protein